MISSAGRLLMKTLARELVEEANLLEEAEWAEAIARAKRREAAAEEVGWKLAIARARVREANALSIHNIETRRMTQAEKMVRDAVGHHRVFTTQAYPADRRVVVWLQRGLRATFTDLDRIHGALRTSMIDLAAVRGGHREESWNPYRGEHVAVEVRLVPGALFEVC